MGDSGSMLLGLLLAAAAITADRASGPAAFDSAASLLPPPCRCSVPIAVLFIPFVDLRAGRHPPHPRGPVAVLAGQAAPAPPAARDRPLAPPGGARHVPLGGPALLRRRRALHHGGQGRVARRHRRTAGGRRRRRAEPAGPAGGARGPGSGARPPSASAAGPTTRPPERCAVRSDGLVVPGRARGGRPGRGQVFR